MNVSEDVRVQQGRLAGSRSADGEVVAFKGVPYAEPPVGERRWRPPLTAASWEGTRPAKEFARASVQPPTPDVVVGGSYGPTSEDCLYLNVWTAARETEERLPVMVWLHHGAFRYGGTAAPMYDGENLARAGAVVVTIAYRLGRLGYMAHPELSAESDHGGSGNYGSLDQIAALEWVQENISAFGGDPSCVTIFGLSAGSASVNLLMASPLGKGLFHRAIGSSGALMAGSGPSSGRADVVQDLDGAERMGTAVASLLDCRSIAELRRLPAEAVVLPPAPLAPPDWAPAWERDGNPVLRGQLDGSYPILDGCFLTRTPHEVFSAGDQANVPLLAGSSAREHSGLPYITQLDGFRREALAEYGDHAERFLATFPATEEDVREVSGSVLGDRVFAWQNWTWMRLHTRTGQAPTFYYHWSYEPPAATEAKSAHKTRGAFHGVELPYVFRNLQAHPWPWTDYDRELRDVVSSFWLSFARTGDPNTAARGPEWPRFDLEAPQAMGFARSVGMGPVPRREQMAFWDDWYASTRPAAAL